MGSQVVQGNLRYSLTQAFGQDASLKAQAYMGVSVHFVFYVVLTFLAVFHCTCLLVKIRSQLSCVFRQNTSCNVVLIASTISQCLNLQQWCEGQIGR